jgi:nicotinamide-nucleotide adenylyltransferase
VKRILVLGRFQPPHVGHLDVMEAASKRADEVIVVVGSAQASYTTENPFTAGERVEMLRAALHARGVGNAFVVPIVDLNRHAEWVAYVEGLVPPFHEVVSNNPLTHELFRRAGYKVTKARLLRRRDLSGTNLRARLSAGKPIDGLVDPAVLRILKRLRAGRRLARLGEPG